MISTTEFNSRFDEKLGVLADKIREFECVISGSFVISTILNENFNGDIDIYVKWDHITSKGSSFIIDSDFDRWIVTELGGVYSNNGSYLTYCDEDRRVNYKYYCNNMILNIINVDVDSKERIYEYINNSSDLDICTSTYDGFNTRYIHSILERKAKSINTNLIGRGDKFEPNKEKLDSYVRCFGLEIYKKTYKSYMNGIIRNRKLRIMKYEMRGFNIETDIVLPINREEYLRYIFHRNSLEIKLIGDLRDFIRGKYFYSDKKFPVVIGRNYKIISVENSEKNITHLPQYNENDTNPWIKHWSSNFYI